ncbi:RsfA family transcriptional regulator [Ornithinibacillus gellani]|uniref:RsfA family transcriptional regulator n=1 Tax=Ornithinibacillus gellani TaxID=2293253 RepID=UPI000F4A5192|nr:RsfA family transcriptional regulator [Ornithinibacillus gellani]TQS75664.1 RsfA family transcriptional regulator [Ornithinibacillus gellani]
MNATRQDAWTGDEDLLLAETVLQYIRIGKTQLEAFKEVAKKLSRTSAACGFRWNATLRKNYHDAILQAKQQRKVGAASHHSSLLTDDPANDEIEHAIKLLERMKQEFQKERQSLNTGHHEVVAHLQQENHALKEKLQRYESAWNEMGNVWSWVQKREG